MKEIQLRAQGTKAKGLVKVATIGCSTGIQKIVGVVKLHLQFHVVSIG